MYYSDKPILTCEEDSLKRKYFAELMAKTLVNLQNSDTFTIGMYGRWGNGKTSLVNMMLKEIEENQTEQEKLIIVHFEPWNFSNTDQLLEQFFVRLTNVFRDSKDEKMQKIGEALEKYSDAFEMAEVIPYVGGLLSLFGKKGAQTLGRKLKKGSDEKDILKQKENVINLLSQQDKRVLIVIDDIDRLNNEQIRQVFQLITSVAKFPNTTYFLVFDKEIVVKALEVSYEFLQEIKASINDITPDRAKTIIAAIFKCASKLDMIMRKNILSISASNCAEHLVLTLFERIDTEERLEFWKKQINDSDLSSLPAIALVINMMELGYGRLAASGEERGYEKIISLEELSIKTLMCLNILTVLYLLGLEVVFDTRSQKNMRSG